MVSKASEDLPEPDRPVNTTSLSRGISRSTFLRLCSRAPRMFIERSEPALFWRLALITSSISAFPDACVLGRARKRNPKADASGGCARNIGRTSSNFQSRVQTINGLLRPRFELAADGTAKVSSTAARNKKGRREAGLFEMIGCRRDRYENCDRISTSR